MPGDGIGDRVHNFFAQDNLSQGQHQSHVLEGTWPINSNGWVNGQRQMDVLNSSSTNYPIQNSDINIGQTSFPPNATNGLNFSQADPRPDFSKNQSRSVQPYLNGFLYGSQIHHSKQNEANFLVVNTDTDQQQITSRGFPIHGKQVRGPEQQAKVSDRSETSLPSVSFDLFGGQQQMNHQQANMMQAFQCQQSGLNDMQQLQQQLMIRNIQDLQRQQQLQLLDLRPQNMINPDSPFAKHSSAYQSSPFNGTRDSDAPQYPRTLDPGTNWMNRGSSPMQGSPGGFIFPTNAGQTQHLTNVVPQQVDQSLYGVPVSSSRGLTFNKYSRMEADESPISQIVPPSISLHSNPSNNLPNQIRAQEGTRISNQKFQTENIVGHTSSQSLNNRMMDIVGLQKVNSMQRNASQRDFMSHQEMGTQLETLHERRPGPATSSQNEVALDPTEEKILYGSEGNIWAAFGDGPSVSGETGNLFDDGVLPSLNSGSWSALMQSAVAETSSSDMGPQECGRETFHNTDGSPSVMTTLMHSDNVKQASLPDCNLKIQSALNSGSIPPSNEINTHFMELSQLGNKFQSEPSRRLATDLSHRSGQSFEEASKWSNHSLIQKPIAEGSKKHGNASPHSLGTDRTAKAISANQASGEGRIQGKTSGWNSQVAIPPDRDRVSSSHENMKSLSSPDNQFSCKVPMSNLWRPNSANHQDNKGVLSLNGRAASTDNSYSVGVGRETSPFVQNNYFLNQWKSAHHSSKFQGSENLGRMLEQVNDYNQVLGSLNSRDGVARHDLENHLTKENSNDSHISNLSQQASGDLRDVQLSDKSDSRFLASGQQKPTDQLSRKRTVSRKFQYHPMGNLDEDVEPGYSPVQLTQGQLQKDSKGADEEPSTGSFPGCGPSMPVSFGKPFDSHTSTKAYSTSQNMLELLHKVDESKDRGATAHLNSECNLSSQLPGTDNFDESAGRLQRTQSSASQGFGLQLGPPSQRLHTSELSSSTLNAQSLISSMHADCSGPQIGGKGLPRVPMSSVQSLPFPIVESQIEFKDENYAVTGHPGNENSLYRSPENYRNFSSDTLRVRNQLQDKQITMVNEKLALNRHIDSSYSGSTLFVKRGSAETLPPDTSLQIQEDNPTSSGKMDDVRNTGLPTTSYIKDQISGSHHIGMSGTSQPVSGHVIHNMWGKIHAPQQTLASQYPKVPSRFSELSPSTIAESSSLGDLGISTRHDLSSNLGAICANSTEADEEEHNRKESSGHMESSGNVVLDSKTDRSTENVPSVKKHLDDSPVNFDTTQKDIENFGRLLKPNRFLNKKPGSLDQITESMDEDSDLNSRVSKRMKGSGNDVDSRVNLMTGQRNEGIVDNSLHSNFGAPEDSRNVSFSLPSDILPMNPSQSHSSTKYGATGRVEHSQVHPQMAPTWFNQCGVFKNEQMVPIDNEDKAQQEVASRPIESLVAVGKSPSFSDSHRTQDKSTTAPTKECQVGGTILNSSSLASESHQPWKLNATGQYQAILSPKRHKITTSEIHPWHKETSYGSQKLPILNVAEAAWSKALNCPSAKVEDNAELIEDAPPVFRSKRRLKLTTQLMQPLFHAPPATFLSADAGLTCESMTYAVSRLALGDMCCSVSLSKDVGLPPDDVNLHSTNVKRRGDLRFAKVTEGFLEKARKLENEFSRLDKSSSILEHRMECSDMEKFSVINRFAKFHGRGQTDNAETASTSLAATTQKPCAQRYVTVVPMPRCPPDSVQCLSI